MLLYEIRAVVGGRERGEREENGGVGGVGRNQWRWSLGREGRKMEEDEGWRGGRREGGIGGGPSRREMKWGMKRVGRKKWSMGKGGGGGVGREHSTE